MNRDEWEHSAHSLRKLMHKFNEEDRPDRAIEYCFGFRYNPMFDFFNLWDGTIKSSVATIKIEPEKAIIRFTDGWLFNNELKKFRMDDRPTKFIKSENTQRHNDWVHMQLQSRVERAIRERKDFLDLEARKLSGKLFTVHIPLSPQIVSRSLNSVTSLGLYGQSPGEQSSSSELVVTVDFGETTPSESDKQKAFEMVKHGMDTGEYFFKHNAVLTMEELNLYYNRAQQNRRMREAEEAMIREMRPTMRDMRGFASQYAGFRTDGNTEEIYGRDVEQLREYFHATSTISEGQSLTEEDIVRAVGALDEANVPRERGRWDREELRHLVEMRDDRDPREERQTTTGIMPNLYAQDYGYTESTTTINIPFSNGISERIEDV